MDLEPGQQRRFSNEETSEILRTGDENGPDEDE